MIFSKAIDSCRLQSVVIENRWLSKAVDSIRSISVGCIRLLSIAIAFNAVAAIETAGEWAESTPPIRFEGREWAETVMAGATNNEAIAVEGGRLQSNAVWSASATHMVLNTVYVPSGVTLTITEGTIVKYCPDTTIKVEDGGNLVVNGAEGSDVVLTAANDATAGETVDGFDAEQSIAFEGIRLQSGSAAFTDNGWLQTRGFNYGAFPSVSVNATAAVRNDGHAYVPFTLSGSSRDAAFSVDWVAVEGTAKFGEDYTLASGTISWTGTSQSTKTLAIPLNAENITGEERSFTVRITAARCANVAQGAATVKIVEREGLALECAEEWAESEPPIRFESRDWAEPVIAGATNNQSIAVEGGRLQSNAVWSASATHLVLNTVYVPSGVTLTITEGAVVKYCPGTSIKVEDGGQLVVNGAEGNDVVLTAANDDTAGETIEGFDVEQSIAFEGIRLQSGSASFTDNGWLQTRGFAYGAYPNVCLNDVTAFRSAGEALLPVTISGSRNQSFTVDWIAEDGTAKFGEDYTLASGTISWTGTSQGTKTLTIPLVVDHFVGSNTEFKVRLTVSRGANIARGECTVTIKELDTIAFDCGMAESEPPIRFESRDWAEPVIAGATNNQSIAVEGGRLQSNAVWSASATHLVLNIVYVPSGVTLTITEGAVVKYCPGTTIFVEDGGNLVVNGAEGNDVVLTAANDAAVGETIKGFGAEQSIAFEGIRLQSGSASFTDNGWLQTRGFGYGAYPTLTLHEATANRNNGIIYLPVTVSGSTRNQSFTVDWLAEDGTAQLGRDYSLAGGRLTWSKSGDGTKYIEIPLEKGERCGTDRTFRVRFVAARAVNLATDAAVATIAEYENGGITDMGVAESEASEASPEFSIVEGVKTQPLFLNPVETVHYSGKWQTYDANEAALLRVTIETDNGRETLKEVSPTETGSFDLDLARYPVGYYTLKHDILDEFGETLATMQKTFSIADEEDVVMHGGSLTQNETWEAGKVHVVYQTVVVPSIYTIFIEPGAIVKFMTGTGIDISQGGAFFANGIVFTHINDDTVGGDTLSDGYTVAPPMDAYFLSGNFTFGDDTELRGITQNTALAGTISTQKTLSRGSTYRVSGTVTIASGASLTIPPGTVLKMESGAAIVVNSGATLNAIGTRAAPIVITSIKDDAISGDTNGDGDATIPQPGDWVEIGVNGGTANFEFVSILYSSKNQTTGAINQNGGVVRFVNSEIAHGMYDAVGVESGNFYMTNSVIRDCLLAFRHWAMDPIVNSIIYDCGRLTQGGGQTFVNCIFSNIAETWEAFAFPNSTYHNCCFWNEGGSVLTVEGEQDAMTVCGSAGNIWGDPLFVDAANGDFRIRDGSPCVDAADNTVVPELDFFGQPRITITEPGGELVGQLADIGICEVMPRDVVSDIDLLPQSVRTTTNAVPGQLLFVKWEIANVGGAEVNAAWRDTVSLVSESGREVVLGDKTTSSRVAIGGSVFCSGYFTVPAISEGTWYPKVNVNSYHDIFEGSLSANNALVGERAVSVGLEVLDPSVSREGVINAGTPTVLKFAFGEDDANRMVVFDVPNGVTATWGFGFMPQGASKSGAMTASGDGVMFKVPDGATEVYVVLESDTTTTYDLFTASEQMVITSVAPATLPSSGTTTLTINGAGFGDDCEVALVSPVGRVVLNAPQKDSSGNLIATIDCATLIAGRTYDVCVVSGGMESTLPNAVNVIKAEGKGILDLEYSIPSSVRPGRVFTFTLTYRNTGNKDMCVPLLTVQDTGNDAVNPIQFSLDGERFTAGGFQFVGADSNGGFDALHPGDEVTLHVMAKIPPANNGSTAISVRANTESDIMAKYTTEIDRYLTPSMKAEFASTSDDELKARGERLAQVFGANNGEMVQNFAAFAKQFYECNGFALQKVDDLMICGIRLEECSDGSEQSPIEVSNSDLALQSNLPSMEMTLQTSSAQELADQTRRNLNLDSTTGAYIRREGGGYAKLEDVDVDLSDKSILIIAHGLNDGLIKSVWMREIGNALASEYDEVIYVNWSVEAYANFLDGVAGRAFFWNWNAINLAELTVDKYRQLLHVSERIGPVATLVYSQLTARNFNSPGKCVCIGHSFGSHLTGRISRMMGSVKAQRAKRHIGLDTAAISAVPQQYVISRDDAQITEYYRSSSGSGRDDPYAMYNYIVANRNTFGFNISHPIDAFTKDHSYSHEWLVFNIRHGKTSGIGYWSDHGLPSVNGRCLSLDVAGYIGVIDGQRDVLECAYPYYDSAYEKSQVHYPGNKSEWSTMRDAWLHAVDLETETNLSGGTEFKANEKFEVSVSATDNADIMTLQRDYDYKLDVSFVRDDGKVESLIDGDEQASSTFNINLKIPESCIPDDKDKVDGKLVFTVTAGKRNPVFIGLFGPMYWSWDSHNEIYMPDNTDEVQITLKRSGLPTASINGYFQDGFTIVRTIRYKSEAAFNAAVAKGDTFEYSFDGSDSDPGKKKKIVAYQWSNGSKQVSTSGRYSATANACYPISLTVINDAEKEDTVSGQLVVAISIGEGEPIEQPKSYDPNEMRGKLGLGNPETERFVKPGEELTYTIYFENKTNATAAAQEVYVTNPLSEWLDWSTFKMGEVAFGDQIDLGLVDKQSGTSEATMKGTNFIVRTTLTLEATDGTSVVPVNGRDARSPSGVAKWYMRIVDPTTDTGWPTDIIAGFLPPNDETGRGEGHLTYTIRVREDAPANLVISNSADIVFDHNPVITTDPAWWNTVVPDVGRVGFVESELYADEGSNVVVRIMGGDAYTNTSVKVYLTYQTAAAADLDLANAALDGVTPKGGLKFPLTLGWAKGEIGVKEISIPVKADALYEGDEFFTLQLAGATGMAPGAESVCTVAIRDADEKSLPVGAIEFDGGYYVVAKGNATAKPLPGYIFVAWVYDSNGKTYSTKATITEKLRKSKKVHPVFAPAAYLRALVADPATGTVKGQGLYADGKAVTLSATAKKGYAFTGWRDADGNVVSLATSLKVANGDEMTTYVGSFKKEGELARPVLTLADTHGTTSSDAATGNDRTLSVGVSYPAALAVEGESKVSIAKVTGLPTGLKYSGGKISGVPTKAGNFTASVVVTLASNKKKTWTCKVPFAVVALPEWARGNFTGVVTAGVEADATMTVGTTGKISGKFALGGTNWTFSASSFAKDSVVTGKVVRFVAAMTAAGTWKEKSGSKTVTKTVKLPLGFTLIADPATSAIASATEGGYFGEAGTVEFWRDAGVSVAKDGATAGGSVSLSVALGQAADGKSVKATAKLNKGYALLGWYRIEGGETNLVSQALSYTVGMAGEDVFLVAAFAKESELARPELVWGDDVHPDIADTNLTVGVAYSAVLYASGEAQVKVSKVAGLPSGLAYKGGVVSGVPTKSGSFTATVTVALSSNSKKTWSYKVPLAVASLEKYAKGTYNGAVVIGFGTEEPEAVGLATITVGATGAISGKFQEGGTNWTLSAKSYTSRGEDAFFCTNLVAKCSWKEGGKTVTRSRSFALSVAEAPNGDTTLGCAVAEEQGADGVSLVAWQNLWGADYKAVGQALFTTKSGKNALSYRTWESVEAPGLGEYDTLSMKVTTAGAVTATYRYFKGTFDAKNKPQYATYTCSTALVPKTPAADGAESFSGVVPLYLPPDPATGFPGCSIEISYPFAEGCNETFMQSQ